LGTVEAIGAPVGTVVRVEDLFYNVPARLKFMKQEATERRQIDALVTRYALAYPAVRFRLLQEGRPALQTSGNDDRREVLAALYGVDVARQMIEVLFDDEGLRLTGFTSPVALTRTNRREITFFVNGRPVQDAALSTALIQAYHTLLMVGRFPLATLFLRLPPEWVDVNVHPAKAEVRFRDPERVFSAVQRGVKRALLANAPVPAVGMARALPGPTAGVWGPPTREIDPAWNMLEQVGTEATATASGPEIRPGSLEAPPTPLLGEQRMPLLRLVGQVAATYLVAEGPDGLYLIDQHAAHERVLFERLMAQHDHQIPSQALLQPAAVELPPAGARLLNEQLTLLGSLGFQVEPFGPATFLVRAIPALLANLHPAAALRAVVEDFEEDETPLQSEVEARLIARICKRAAVKAGQTLDPNEQRALLDGLEACQSPRTCPHGRPTMIHLSVALLERQFGRRGAL
jgi:DNA mismatch repair protein MutL